ncbi:MAG: sigma-54 dependent transcriptional regulator [Verrucomicrobia bacterium]|nr:sigma-54 dependent transcriptional regulator [Verrucomicrobiota bacterium]MDA1065785.1 sigma-54 dependent transcriptional regulator [Verrucomicrobiota bacterium]
MEDSSAKILIIDDDDEIRYSLTRVLQNHKFKVVEAGSGEEGIKVAAKEKPDVIFLDNRMNGISGLETLQHLMSDNDSYHVIMMTAYGTTQTAIEAMKFGAFDYIMKPFDMEKVMSLIGNVLKAKADRESTEDYKPLLNSDDYKEGIVGSSEPMQEVFKQIGQIAASEVSVLITGESGTGKELIAKAICQHSLRSGGAYIAVNCAAIPENLIESELFGHEKGSFTGAAQMRKGKFELCDGGTIFLDEIGDMELSTQTKVLRVLQEGEIQRVGGSETIKVDVRLVTATNKNLEDLVAKKEFREDLYYRLNVARIRLPNLKERSADIPELIDFMLQRLAKRGRSKVQRISSDVQSLLVQYPWPGNVRELENIVNRASVISQGDTILLKDLPSEIREWAETNNLESKTATNPPFAPSDTETSVGPISSKETQVTSSDISLGEVYLLLYSKLRAEGQESILNKIEKAMIESALDETKGNQVKTSSILGITRATLRKRIEQFREEGS